MRNVLAAGLLWIVVPMLLIAVAVGSAAPAGSEDALIRLLIKKGILTEEEYQALKKEAEIATPAPPERGPLSHFVSCHCGTLP